MAGGGEATAAWRPWRGSASADYAGQRAATLSGGQQQRGAIARTLVQGAEAVLADEPVASLDPVSARRVMEALQELNRKDGMTVVVTLHHVDYACRTAPGSWPCKAGKIVYDGPATGLDRKLLIDIYGPEIEDALTRASRGGRRAPMIRRTSPPPCAASSPAWRCRPAEQAGPSAGRRARRSSAFSILSRPRTSRP